MSCRENRPSTGTKPRSTTGFGDVMVSPGTSSRLGYYKYCGRKTTLIASRHTIPLCYSCALFL